MAVRAAFELPSYLTNRKTYVQWCLPSRIKHLQDKITQYKPKAVVFYGLGYKEHWQKIAGIDLFQGSDKIYTGYNGTTFFVMTKHPSAHGVTNEYFYQVGRLIGASNQGQ